jgi:hypothetical protein
VISNRYVNSFVYKVLITLAIFFGNFYLAAQLSVVDYATFMFGVFLVKNMPLMYLGLNQGLVYYLINKDDSLKNEFSVLITLITLISSALISFYYNVFIGLIGLILLPIFILEPILKIKKNFIFNVLPEFIIIGVVVLISFIIDINFELTSHQLSILFILVIIIITISIYFNMDIPLLMPRKTNLVIIKYAFLKLTKKGLGSYIFNFLFFLFLFLDRYLAKKFYGDIELGSLLLAYQLVLASCFFSSIYNSMVVISIGDKLQMGEDIFINLFFRSIGLVVINIFSFSFMFLLIYYFGETYLVKYKSISDIIIPLGISMIVFNIYSSVSPILFFFQRQRITNYTFIALILFVPINYSFSSMYLDLSFFEVATLNYLFFTCVMMLCTIFAFRVLLKYERKHSGIC